jgi:hypothetical protein
MLMVDKRPFKPLARVQLPDATPIKGKKNEFIWLRTSKHCIWV